MVPPLMESLIKSALDPGLLDKMVAQKPVHTQVSDICEFVIIRLDCSKGSRKNSSFKALPPPPFELSGHIFRGYFFRASK